MSIEITNRQKFVLAALATVPRASFSPAQIQKFFFLIDENIAGSIGGKKFSFQPYDYGPFDSAVYDELNTLAMFELVFVQNALHRGERRYGLTENGIKKGEALLDKFLSDEDCREYVSKISEWVRSLPFTSLVREIYREYPDMKEKSIFRD